MTEEVRTRCLEPFFSTKGDKGTGLGLSMVFGIIKRHEGVVEIESELGKGTTFRISLPAQVDTIAAGQSDTTKLVRALRVLVVDDEPVPRDVLQKFLISDGHSVVTANNALEAIRCFQSEPFDLVLTDHAMPGMNGVELASVLRGMRENQPVILVTGFSEWREIPGEQPTGINMMVWKPVPHGELRKALSAVINE
jgi:CheY-like chemotaxis protein